jgi:hypothetical protein
MNRWNIPDWMEREVIERDRCCVYCAVEFTAQSTSRRDRASWEHIINDARIITRENIARCCIGYNASKGTKDLVDWLRSKYCRTHGITSESVASVVRFVLESNARGCRGYRVFGKIDCDPPGTSRLFMVTDL